MKKVDAISEKQFLDFIILKPLMLIVLMQMVL